MRFVRMCCFKFRLVCIGFLLLVAVFKSAHSIYCYQCSATDSSHPFQCNEFLEDSELVPESCDSVYGAQYCIKHVGRFEVNGILCYQCSSSTSIDCGDNMIHLGGITPQNCNHVFEAQYCIKHTGGIGTKRYCSPLDLGNYCDYVKQPGDKFEYRTCLYTCSGDGCNPANKLSVNFYTFLLTSTVILIYIKQVLNVR